MATILIKPAEEILKNLTNRGWVPDMFWVIDPNGPQAFHVSMLQFCGKRVVVNEHPLGYNSDIYDYLDINGYGWDREWVDLR